MLLQCWIDYRPVRRIIGPDHHLRLQAVRLIKEPNPNRTELRPRRRLCHHLRAARWAEALGQRVTAGCYIIIGSERAREFHIGCGEHRIMRRPARGGLLALAAPALPHRDRLALDCRGYCLTGASPDMSHDVQAFLRLEIANHKQSDATAMCRPMSAT